MLISTSWISRNILVCSCRTHLDPIIHLLNVFAALWISWLVISSIACSLAHNSFSSIVYYSGAIGRSSVSVCGNIGGRSSLLTRIPSAVTFCLSSCESPKSFSYTYSSKAFLFRLMRGSSSVGLIFCRLLLASSVMIVSGMISFLICCFYSHSILILSG